HIREAHHCDDHERQDPTAGLGVGLHIHTGVNDSGGYATSSGSNRFPPTTPLKRRPFSHTLITGRTSHRPSEADVDVQEEAAERYDRLPWDHLVPPPDPDRRRWLMGGVVVVVLG